MTNKRRASLEEQERLFGKGPGSTLPEICMALRIGTSGAGEEWDAETVADCVAMLKARLDSWLPTLFLPGKRFDESVRRLVMATVDEVGRKYRKKEQEAPP